LPALRRLPAQVIHNDLHPGNILCDPEMPGRLTGCIDFGDIVCRPPVMELASALGEYAGWVDDFGGACRALLDGVRAETGLEDDLLPLLYDAMLARAVLCAQLASFRLAHSNTDPDIEAVHLPRAIGAVRTISAIDRSAFCVAMSQTA
jgi:Ser/Thr protein kinase RdoA (MazF antagonist)